ncbi:hypothetical protein NQ317_010048 [Molorchus minor]|uniref:Uncharacterized protein n=1 Tax=Molorchus minor TaxID=1323400 RepID=A0ABQ9JLH3_9CUCU|nr:hypothetical protein NQ317_010048 [Molorchus minor]
MQNRQKRNKYHSYGTRHGYLLSIPIHLTINYKHSPVYNCIRLFNSLPPEIRRTKNYNKFKNTFFFKLIGISWKYNGIFGYVITGMLFSSLRISGEGRNNLQRSRKIRKPSELYHNFREMFFLPISLACDLYKTVINYKTLQTLMKIVYSRKKWNTLADTMSSGYYTPWNYNLEMSLLGISSTPWNWHFEISLLVITLYSKIDPCHNSEKYIVILKVRVTHLGGYLLEIASKTPNNTIYNEIPKTTRELVEICASPSRSLSMDIRSPSKDYLSPWTVRTLEKVDTLPTAVFNFLVLQDDVADSPPFYR